MPKQLLRSLLVAYVAAASAFAIIALRVYWAPRPLVWSFAEAAVRPVGVGEPQNRSQDPQATDPRLATKLLASQPWQREPSAASFLVRSPMDEILQGTFATIRRDRRFF